MDFSAISLSKKHALGALFILALLALLFIGLGILGGCGQQNHSGIPLATPVQFPTATWTPFIPEFPTPTYIPTATFTPTPTLTPSPTPPPPTATPKPGTLSGPVPPITQAKGRINIMLLGSDQRRGHYDFRTDAIMLLSYNPKTGATSLVSFPRDTYVYLPGMYYQRINTAMEFGGFPLLASTMEYNFGIRPDYYILINFVGFQQLIDRLGGVDVYVSRRLCDKRTHYGYYCIGPGNVHMDGSLALWYARSRKTTSDFDRARRQQDLLLAIIHRLISFDAFTRAPELYNAYRQMVETNISPGDFSIMVTKATDFHTDGIKTYVLTPPTLIPWRTPQGAYVLLQDYGRVRNILEDALSR